MTRVADDHEHVTDLLARTSSAVAAHITPPPVERVKAIAAHRIARARARALAIAAAAILLVGAGAALVPLSHTTTPTPTVVATPTPTPVVRTNAPPPPALLAETANARWRARTVSATAERSPRRDKI